MLHVLLVILKVAGIVILSILLILLLLLILVLFVPISYSAYAEKKSEMYAKASASWMFHIIYFSFYYDRNGVRQRLRIFGISTDIVKKYLNRLKHLFNFIKTKFKKSKKIKPKQLSKNVDNNELSRLNTSLDNQSEVIEKKPENATKESENTKQVLLNSEGNSKGKVLAQKAVSPKRKKKHKFDFKIWLKKIRNRIIRFLQKIRNVFIKFILTCKNAKDKVKNIKSFLQDERNIEAFRVCKHQIIVALKHVKPKKYKINMVYGTGDPALTGQILGILGMLMPLYKNSANFVPDFENVIFEGDIYLKGRITLAKVLLIAWKLYRDENVKRCYKMIMD